MTYSRSEIIHAIEMTPIGSVTLCAGTAIHRPLPGTFEDLRHDRCAECERLVGDPAATTATHQIVMI